ncbi:MAG: TonB-dependent receptor [Dysgonamonadaceae bacterium]|jgi:TonB-linked SusC/RagA family outer membrane protein|nr:TonB-dependent receptor [Dysgonamonadaceae bacterium]
MRQKIVFFIGFLLVSSLTFAQQQITVSGTVTEGATGDPAIGVSILVKGTTTGVVTDFDGNYTLNNVPSNATLVFSYIGMDTVEEAVNGRSVINVVLSEDIHTLQEVTVIGYGTARRRDLTGSIVSISAADIANRPSSNPLAALQGRVAGVQVVNTGRAGQDPEIRIRGTNSINGFRPLYVVDGLFADNINFLNPSDIESMEILKDPSSLAIFGVRGANGVIIITTRRAREGQTLVNVNTSIGFKNVGDRIRLTNAAQFRELYNEQRMNQGANPFDYTNWQADTDWQNEIFQTGLITNNNVSITGASDRNRFYMGIGYMTEEGTIKSEKFSQLTLNLSSEYSMNNRLRFGFQVNGARTLPPDAKQVSGALRAAPIAPVYKDFTDPATGRTERLLHTLPDFQRAQVWNPMIAVELEGAHNIATNYRGTGNIFGEVDILKNLRLRTTFSLDYQTNDSRQFQPMINVYNPDYQNGGGRENIRETEVVTQFKENRLMAQQDYILTYDNRFGRHGITATAGITTNYREFSLFRGARTQRLGEFDFSIPSNNPDKWWISSIGNRSMTNEGEQWRRFTMSYLMRALYNYNNRYLFNASYRRDGSSVFRPVGNTWDNFYSVGAGWVISEEDFMQNQDIIDYLKLKGSWGVLGSENTGGRNYPAFPGLDSSGNAVFGDNIIPGYTYQFLVQNLGWEKTHAWEAGFEMNLLNQRLRIEPTYYNKLTKDIIVLLASRTGAQNSLENIGEIRNRGLELAISWHDNIGQSDFRYSLGFNLTTIDNKVLSLGRDAADAIFQAGNVARTLSGYPIAHFYGYVVEGVYQNWEDIRQSPPNRLATVRPGDLKFKDIHGDGEITDKSRTMIGSPTPDATYGFNIGLGWKGIDFSVDMMGVYGNEIYRNWDSSAFAQFNYLENRMKRWNGEGTSNWEPILDPSRSVNLLPSTYFIEDGSFFRIRNIQLGYTFNQSILNRLHLSQLRLFANVQNLKTWSRNSGYTPEIGGADRNPALESGIDNGSYPMPIVTTFGLNLTF